MVVWYNPFHPEDAVMLRDPNAFVLAYCGLTVLLMVYGLRRIEPRQAPGRARQAA